MSAPDQTRRLSGTAKPRVLIIDDELELHSFLAAVLEGRGYLVFSALGASEGLDMFEALEPDLVLLDAAIPGGNSLDMCRLMTDRTGAPAVVILADVEPNEADLDLANECGVSDIIEKPFDIEGMLGRLARAVGARREEPLN